MDAVTDLVDDIGKISVKGCGDPHGVIADRDRIDDTVITCSDNGDRVASAVGDENVLAIGTHSHAPGLIADIDCRSRRVIAGSNNLDRIVAGAGHIDGGPVGSDRHAGGLIAKIVEIGDLIVLSDHGQAVCQIIGHVNHRRVVLLIIGRRNTQRTVSHRNGRIDTGPADINFRNRVIVKVGHIGKFIFRIDSNAPWIVAHGYVNLCTGISKTVGGNAGHDIGPRARNEHKIPIRSHRRTIWVISQGHRCKCPACG